jgi:hypothetical protein
MRRSGPQGPEEAAGGSGGRGVLLLAIAVVLGIIILQATDDGGGSSDVATETEVASPTTTSEAPATTLPQLRAPAEVKVLPANGTQVSGLGARVGDELKAKGYIDTLSAVSANTTSAATTSVEFSGPEYAADAVGVANNLGLPPSAVKPLSSPPPVSDTRGAHVVVVAGQDLERLSGGSSSTSSGQATTTTTSG